MTPEWVGAICAVVTLMLLYTGTILGAGFWLTNLLNKTKEEILTDFNAKHAANAQTVKALEELVIRHDVLLNPEFNGQFGATRPHFKG
jgi:hypothetical protein